MCVVSFIGDQFQDNWKDRFPPFNQGTGTWTISPSVSRQEFEELKQWQLYTNLHKTLITDGN